MRLILTTHEIPSDTIVCKPTGEKTYILKRDIKIFGDKNNKSQNISVEKGIAFLFSSDSGDINIISEESKLAVDFDLDEMIDFLESMKSEQ